MFVPPKKFAQFYPMEEKFTKKWSMHLVEAVVPNLKKKSTCPVDDFQVFKDLADKRLETHLKAFFSLAGSTMEPVVAAIVVFQSLKGSIRQLGKKTSLEGLKELP